MSELRTDIDYKKLLIAHHEAGHAVMALVCNQRIQKVSLKEMGSPRGTDNYLGHTKLEPFEQNETLTINEAIRRVMISLGGYASEVLYLGGSIKIGCDDLTFAVKRVEDMMQSEAFRNLAARLPIPEAGALDMIENPTVRAFIDYKLGSCVETLAPLKPVIQSIAEELYKKEELTGEEIAALFNSFMQSSRQPQSPLTGVMRVTESYEICYPNPLNLKVGDRIQLFDKPGPEKWRDWKWCKDSTGNEGWISETYFKRSAPREAIIIRDYTAKEIAVSAGDDVELVFTDCGWSWCRKTDGNEGWLPTEILE